jgi:hypothetical protein
MIIHTSATEQDINEAARAAGVDFTRLGQRGSRKRDRAFDVILTGRSPRRQNGGEDYSASWDQWGVFLAHVFTVDPSADATYYYSADHFHYATAGRYAVPRMIHCETEARRGSHRFEWSGVYQQRECTDCGTVYRYMSREEWARVAA